MKLKCDTCGHAMVCGIKEKLEELTTQIEDTSELKERGIEIGCKHYTPNQLMIDQWR